MELSPIGQKKDAPSDARQVRSRKALRGALLELLTESSFDQLTIREITARAKTGYATFFRHYPTKEALLGDIASEEIRDLLMRTRSMMSGEQRYQSALALCQYVDTHRPLWSALLTGGAAAIVRGEILRQTRQLADHDRQAPDWLPHELAAEFATGASMDLIAWWLSKGHDQTPDEMAVILDRLVMEPLIVPTDAHRKQG